MSIGYQIPDSVANADFYNAYAMSFIAAFYNCLDKDSTISMKELLTVGNCDAELAKENIVKYFENDETWSGIFNLAHSSFYENDKVEKPKVVIDSLVNISMSYFDIAGYSEERGFMYHFVCGTNPIDFNLENKTSLLVCDFCREALKNPEMNSAHQKIINDIGNLIKSENDTIVDLKKIKQIYEPKLYGLLKEEKVLKESLIAYYEKRKDIEPFILVY